MRPEVFLRLGHNALNLFIYHDASAFAQCESG
jgi:hypothetical protein